jgi:hypothetical protein
LEKRELSFANCLHSLLSPPAPAAWNQCMQSGPELGRVDGVEEGIEGTQGHQQDGYEHHNVACRVQLGADLSGQLVGAENDHNAFSSEMIEVKNLKQID